MSRSTRLARTAIPPGVASFLPDLAAGKRILEEQVLATFSRWGYQEVVPPLFEYLDVLAQGLVPETVERGYKLEDRQDGRLMVLRPDVTAQVARMAAARRADPQLPHRFGYATNVFAHAEVHRGQPRERFQVGAERLGPGGAAADIEILALLMTVLRGLGLDNFVVTMGQVGYFRAVMGELKLAEAEQAGLADAVYRKDVPTIRALLAEARVPAERHTLLEQIPSLIGGPEVFDAARRLTRCREALRAVDHLEEVVEGLNACGLGRHILVDLGEARDLSYYTGIVFDVLVPGMGFGLGGGGRYDDLLERFGHPMPATGFALDVERVMEALSRSGEPVASASALDYVIDGPVGDAYRAASALRAAGLRVSAEPAADPATPRVRAEGDKLLRVTDGGTRPTSLDELVKAASGVRRA